MLRCGAGQPKWILCVRIGWPLVKDSANNAVIMRGETCAEQCSWLSRADGFPRAMGSGVQVSTV
jgi:hypothetical protein